MSAEVGDAELKEKRTLKKSQHHANANMMSGDTVSRCGARPVDIRQAVAASGSSSPPQLLEDLRPSCGVRRRGGKATDHTNKDRRNIKIMQWNAEGITPKKDALLHFLSENEIDVCCIQETHLTSKKPFKIRGYESLRNDREGRTKGGVLTLVKRGLQGVEKTKFTGEAEFLTVKLSAGNTSIDITNYYCPDDKLLSLDTIEVGCEDFIIIGDFNSHSPSWGYNALNKRGEDLETWQDENQLILINEPTDQPTFYSRRWHSTTTPDLAFCTENLHKRISRQVCSQLGGSDHRPVILTLSRCPPKSEPQRLRWNYKKANWSLYAIRSNELTSNLQVEEGKDPNKIVSEWTQDILKAAKETIPRGLRKNYKPYWNKTLETSHKTLDLAREQAENNPSRENHIRLQKCKAEYRRLNLESKRKGWREKTASLNMEKDTNKLWKLVKSMNDEGNGQPTISIEKDGYILSGKQAADTFIQEYAEVATIQVPKQRLTEVKEELKQRSQLEELPEEMFMPITMNEVKTAIKKLKMKKSPGPDGISNEMIVHLGNAALKKLLEIFNLSWNMGNVPQIWKDALMIPLHKKGKDKSNALSYRPISLTSCVCKTMERTINNRLQWYLEKEKLIAPEQAGFRQYRSTEDQTTHLTQVIEDAFQKKKVVLASFIDLQKAFDKVWKEGLKVKLQRNGISGCMKKWIESYLHNRRARVLVNGHVGRKRLLREGVPQGGVLSPSLFILFINDIIQELPRGIQAALYADDLVLWCTEDYATSATYRMQLALDKLEEWTQKWCVSVNKEKSSATLFALSSQKPGKLKIGNQPLPFEDEQTYLGVTFDRHLTWRKQIEKAEATARKKLAMMRKLAGTKWGASEKILTQVYHGTVRPHLEYGSNSFWTAAQTHQNALEKTQNQALRIITGAMRSTPIQKMQEVTGIPPLKKRWEAKALTQFTKIKAMEGHPMHERIGKLESGRLKRTSFTAKSKVLLRKFDNVPQDVSPINQAGKPPNWKKKPSNIIINTSVPDLNSREDTSKEVQKSLTMEMIEETYPKESWTHIYTDGSAVNAIQNGGAGVSIQENEISLALAIPIGTRCTNYKAEVEAITIAAKTMNQNTNLDGSIVFFTDALSVLKTLESGGLPELNETLEDVNSTRVVLQWIPAHCGIPGNEEADRLAKIASGKDQPNNVRQTFREAQQQIKTIFRPAKIRDDYHQLTRAEQVIIFRLRTGHNRLNQHMHRRMRIAQSAVCSCGEGEEDAEHVLQHCHRFSSLRKEIWPTTTLLKDKLFGPLDQLRKTTSFIFESGLQV